VERLNYRRDVLPRLTADTVYGSIRWTSQRGRYWHAQCPFHDDRDPKSRRFSIDTQTLGYRCFSCGKSGDALKWLAGDGQVTAETFRKAEQLAGIYRTQVLKSPKLPKPAGRLPATRTPKSGQPSPKVAAMWSLTQPAAETPARRYLERRLAWPPLDSWLLPRDVRWIAAEDMRRGLGWPQKTLPQNMWAGCIAFGYRPPDSSSVRAVKLEALTADGQPCQPRWRRNAGPLNGLRFVACNLPGGCLHLGEGEVTALALAIRCTAMDRGMAAACGGTSGMTATACSDPSSRAVQIHCDRDHAGRLAAIRLARTLRTSGRKTVLAGLDERETNGMDAADELADEIRKRLAIRSEEGMSTPEALTGAWSDMLARLSNRK